MNKSLYWKICQKEYIREINQSSNLSPVSQGVEVFIRWCLVIEKFKGKYKGKKIEKKMKRKRKMDSKLINYLFF